MRRPASSWTYRRLREICERIDYGLTASSSPHKVALDTSGSTDIQGGDARWSEVPFASARASTWRR